VLAENEFEIRVRYQETDAQGHVHHANYLTYFETGRTEQLRALGLNYRDLEDQGLYLVVVKATCQYHQGARYDDLLRIVTTTSRIRSATIEHQYRIFRGDELLVEGTTRLGCVDAEGTVKRLPGWITGEDLPEN
jgi:acyl-CoA thioester hydrolase